MTAQNLKDAVAVESQANRHARGSFIAAKIGEKYGRK
jgi:hypothetical protein